MGLIDGVAYHDQIEKELKAKLGYKETDSLRDCKGCLDYKRVAARVSWA